MKSQTWEDVDDYTWAKAMYAYVKSTMVKNGNYFDTKETK